MIKKQQIKSTDQNVNLISINNVMFLNTQFTHHVVYTGQLIHANLIQKQLYFSFYVKVLHNIRLEQENNKKILILTLGDLKLQVKVIKNSQQYIFDEGLYRNYLVTVLHCQNLSISCQIGRKQIKIKQWTKLLITIQKNILFNSTNTWIINNCIPVLEVGNSDCKKTINCKIKSILLSTVKPVLREQQSQYICGKSNLYDGPLDTLPTTQIPDIYSLRQYSSPQSKSSRLFLCHDMEGGYKQDMNAYNPFPQQKTKYRTVVEYYHTYRNLHLMQAQIFNYFSHYLITIPPLHWRRLCRKMKTKCLGTYIIEKCVLSQQEYFSEYSAKLLAYLCRKYRFDGYLLNIQIQVKNIQNLLLPWLSSLLKLVHEVVPGSKIIWYDSITNKGKINYQNQLNQLNKIFYQKCDGIFLNYWWNQQKLIKTINHASQHQIIYVGNDCFGRNTFGGGKYNIYKAVNTIKKIDNTANILVPALFAMGYTYEMDKSNVQIWRINEKCMYRGMSHIKFEVLHNKWIYQKKGVNGFNWEISNQWAITSFQLCVRMYRQYIAALLGKDQINGNLVINFITTVAGTGPKFSDPYRVTLRALIGQVIINQTTTEMRVASQSQKTIQLKLTLDENLITQQTTLMIIEEGQDCEKWSGNFGSKFKNDQLFITKYSKENDWIAKIKSNFYNGVSLPYVNYYNMGHGYGFYIMGSMLKKSYDFISDQDVNFVYIMNPPFNVNIYYDDAFMGGTCMMIEGTNKLKLVQLDLKKQQNITKLREICCRITVKNREEGNNGKFNLLVKIENQTKNAIMKEQHELANRWRCYIFSFQLQSSNVEEKTTLYLESSSSTNSYLLGQTAIYEQKNSQTQPKDSIKLITISQSQNNPPVAPIFFDICIQMKQQCRILVKFGQEFGCFGWADEDNLYKIIVKNVHGNMQSNNNGLMNFKQIREWNIDSREIWLKHAIELK